MTKKVPRRKLELIHMISNRKVEGDHSGMCVQKRLEIPLFDAKHYIVISPFASTERHVYSIKT